MLPGKAGSPLPYPEKAWPSVSEDSLKLSSQFRMNKTVYNQGFPTTTKIIVQMYGMLLPCALEAILVHLFHEISI